MFRFAKCFKAMMAKDLTDKINLRPGDEGRELADHINEFNGMLDLELAKMKDVANSIHQDILQLNEALDDSNPEERKCFNRLSIDIEKLNKLLFAFKTINHPLGITDEPSEPKNP